MFPLVRNDSARIDLALRCPEITDGLINTYKPEREEEETYLNADDPIPDIGVAAVWSVFDRRSFRSTSSIM